MLVLPYGNMLVSRFEIPCCTLTLMQRPTLKPLLVIISCPRSFTHSRCNHCAANEPSTTNRVLISNDAQHVGTSVYELTLMGSPAHPAFDYKSYKSTRIQFFCLSWPSVPSMSPPSAKFVPSNAILPSIHGNAHRAYRHVCTSLTRKVPVPGFLNKRSVHILRLC
jgi:hypothetical protein